MRLALSLVSSSICYCQVPVQYQNLFSIMYEGRKLSPVEEKVLNKGRFLGLHSALKLNIYLWKSFYLAYPETFWLGFRQAFSKLNNHDSFYDQITVAISTSVELLSIQFFAFFLFCFFFVFCFFFEVCFLFLFLSFFFFFFLDLLL